MMVQLCPEYHHYVRIFFPQSDFFSDFITFDVGHHTVSMNDNPILVSPCKVAD